MRFGRLSTGGFSEPIAFFGTQVAFTDVFAQILEHGAPPTGGSATGLSATDACILSYYLPVMPENRRLFRAGVEQFLFVCYRTKVRFLAVTAWAAWSTGPSPLPLLASRPLQPSSSF